MGVKFSSFKLRAHLKSFRKPYGHISCSLLATEIVIIKAGGQQASKFRSRICGLGNCLGIPHQRHAILPTAEMNSNFSLF